MYNYQSHTMAERADPVFKSPHPRSPALPCIPRPTPYESNSPNSPFTPSTPETHNPQFSYRDYTSAAPSSPSFSPLALPNLEAAEDYKISNKVLGKGTYSQVRLALNPITGSYAAAKCVDLRTHDNEFENEALNLSLTSHPNIVKLHYSTKRNRRTVGVLFLEYLPYSSLFQHISKVKSLSENEALHILKQLVNGVAHLHDKKLSHMDLKPENIAYDESSGRVVIFDLGLSLQVDPSKPTVAQGLIGSPLYMAPEVLKHQNYDPRQNDIWGLGVMLYEMITGNPPFFQCETMQDLVFHVEAEDLVVPEGISIPTRKLITKMLSFNPQERLNIYQVKKKLMKMMI